MPTQKDAGPEATKRILIVDDEPDVVSYLEMLFRDSGYDTLTATDGTVALDLTRKEKPDLVTLDISMPRASGTRFYREIKTDPTLASIPVVIVTAVTGYGGDPKGYEKFLSRQSLVPAPEGFFAKPIDREEFLAAVKKLLSS
ncbi:MAG: response regulator [Gemmatimonadota bacterium]|jgi:CheY-like chemotaxis protein